jgi:hypothetical protein
MSTERVIAERSAYFARPGRRAIVILDLADLRGPIQGRVELPLRLFWYPDRTFDLDESTLLRELYETVLQEASRPEDLTSYLNETILVEVWSQLHLPRGLRQVWERRHKVLREGAA